METFMFWFTIISGICSVAGFAMAIFVYINVDKIKIKIEKQTKNYEKQHDEVVKILGILRDNLFHREIAGLKIRSKLREELYYLKKHFNNVLTKDIKKKINSVIKAILNDDFNYNKVCDDIDYIIAQFRSDEL